MLVMFNYKNFGPFKESVSFDMRAVKSYKEHSYNLIEDSFGDPLLKVATIYGANASGKSNFISAYDTFSTIVQRSFEKNDKKDAESFLDEQYYPFLFDQEETPTEFEAVYRIGQLEYKYGFIYDSQEILYEWLYKTSLKTNRTSRIIERSPNKIELGSTIKATCEKYIENIDSDVLALSFFSSLKLRSVVFKEVLYCINGFLPFSLSCDQHSEFMLNRYFAKDFNEEEKPKLLAFLNAIDVGIKGIDVERNKKDISVYTIHVGKDKETYRFPLELESDGTRRAIAVYSLIRLAVLYNKGLLIDEFNNQLHPLLQKYLIDLFYEETTRGQLIYTTHDTSLLDKKYMRRDQIWFVNKDDNGEASLYSLAEFKIRNDASFGKDYLGGIYGGIPILKDFSFMEDA